MSRSPNQRLAAWAKQQPRGSITPLPAAAAAMDLSIDQIMNLVNPAFNGPHETCMVHRDGLAIQVGGPPPHIPPGQIRLF